MAVLGALGPQASLSAFAQVSGLEEVVVTAQRREQSIMEVPIAVTLVSGQELETFNLEVSHDLQFWFLESPLRPPRALNHAEGRRHGLFGSGAVQ